MNDELVHHTPGPALAGVAVRCAGYSHRAEGPVRFHELPGAFVPLILDLDRGWDIAPGRAPDARLERFGSFLGGLTEGPVTVQHPGTACCLQIDLTPLGARRLAGVPMHELAGRCVGLEDILGAPARELVERLADTPGWPARFAIAERAIADRLAAALPPRREVAWALGRIEASGGTVPIGALARELGWSHRRLIAAFRDQVGLPPKRVARIVRFERVQQAVAVAPGDGWARVAAACGFADQAHLAREVGELAGVTPTVLRAEAVNSVQDRVGVAA